MANKTDELIEQFIDKWCDYMGEEIKEQQKKDIYAIIESTK